jgi:hypothetical protein
MSKTSCGCSGMNIDRYTFDFEVCTSAKGWAQLDTRQDASYYGNWVNPTTFETMSYCEGDIIYTQYENEAEFIAGLTETLNWHSERDYGPKIDGMCNDEIIAALTRLGFAEYLH